MKHPWSSQRFRTGAHAAGRPESLIAAAESAAKAIKQVNPDLPVILTLHHLCHLTRVSAECLQRIIFRIEDPYRTFRVKKRGSPNGSAAPARRYRTICVPHQELMRVQRWIAQNVLNPIEPHRASFAFTPNRDLVRAAQWHLEAKWLVKMDIRHFFESLPERHIYKVFIELGYGNLLSLQLARICTRLPKHRLATTAFPLSTENELPYPRSREGHLPQGAPTSPMLANLAMRALDNRIDLISRRLGWIYTRYADDLAFSRRDKSTRGAAMRLVKLVEREMIKFGLASHRQKTTILPPGARKVLLGVLVDSDRVRLTRAFRNNIETHLYALTSNKIGPAAHRSKRGFASMIGMQRHIEGLIAFAHQVDAAYARRLYAQLNMVDWSL